MLTHIELKGALHKLENKWDFITVNKVFLQVVLVAVFQGLGPHTWLLHWPLYLHRGSENVAAATVSPSLQCSCPCVAFSGGVPAVVTKDRRRVVAPLLLCRCV